MVEDFFRLGLACKLRSLLVCAAVVVTPTTGLAQDTDTACQTMTTTHSIARIAEHAYGCSRYSILIELHNHVDDRHLAPGRCLEVPPLAQLLEKEKVATVMPAEAVEGIVAAQEMAKRAVDSAVGCGGGDWKGLSRQQREEFRQVASRIEAAVDVLGKERGAPATRETTRLKHSVITHLKTGAKAARDLGQGHPPQACVWMLTLHNRLALGIYEMIKWAQRAGP